MRLDTGQKPQEEVRTLIRLPRPALATFAAFVLVVAAACGSSSATTAPGASGATGASGASGATGPVAPTVASNPNDPSSIITQVINGGSTVKSFHIKLTLSGTIKAAAFADAGSASGGALPLTGDLKLDGTALEGDVDIANQAAHLALTVPPIAALGGVPITGDLILKDNNLYYKVSLLGPKYAKTDLASLSSLSPIAIPTSLPSPGASAMAGLTDEIAQIRAQLDAAGVKATLVGVEKIGGKDANHINISVPLDKINAAIAAQASSAPGLTIDSASVDLWVYKDTNQIAQFEIKGASSTLGNLDFMLTVSAYDQPVTITAPAASDIQVAAP
jgi:hypothetical protein